MPANRLRELREEQELTQKELAAIIGKDPSTISLYERRVIGIPDKVKQQLAEFFGVSVPFLMRWEEK